MTTPSTTTKYSSMFCINQYHYQIKTILRWDILITRTFTHSLTHSLIDIAYRVLELDPSSYVASARPPPVSPFDG